MTLSSPSFAPDTHIPAVYTCDGQNVSPPLTWGDVPEGTQSLALIVDDPDAPDPAAPQKTWTHWVVYNLPPTVKGLPEAVTSSKLPEGAHVGLNDWHQAQYVGPCPPIGHHRYFHKLYALDTVLPDLEQATKEAVEEAMQGHILAEAELVGTRHKK
jgi:Raf kinase inhibitor-like YbhB/YbcL family protein